MLSGNGIIGNYWEHVIRSDLELSRIRQYVQDNVDQWETDSLRNRTDELKEHDLLKTLFK